MKKPSSRSQRGSRGIKGKHVLQICVLLGVCIWLIYQVKYSHDKKKDFYETDGKKLSEREDGLVKLGRKDLLPGYHKNEKENRVEEDEDEEEINHVDEEKESKSKVENGTHEEEEKEEEDEVAEEDEEDKSKLGEEVVEEDEDENKHEEDEIDEQDHSRTTGDKDDESLEEEKESDEKEKETNHADETDMTVDEAREEHYKADDASSAVSHESRILNTEKLKESSDNSSGTAQENNANATVSEVEVQKEPVLKLGEAESGNSVDKTTTEVKDGDSESSNSEAKSVVTESRGETVNGNSTEAILEASRFLQNETKVMQERSQEDGAPPSGSSDVQSAVKLEQTRNESDPNNTVSANITNINSIQDDYRNSTSESSVTENISGSNTTEVKENSRSEGDDETGEKESSNHFSTEQTEEADDTSESTILQEEREALTDPQTLPDMRIEGNEDDEEAMGAAE